MKETIDWNKVNPLDANDILPKLTTPELCLAWLEKIVPMVQEAIGFDSDSDSDIIPEAALEIVKQARAVLNAISKSDQTISVLMSEKSAGDFISFISKLGTKKLPYEPKELEETGVAFFKLINAAAHSSSIEQYPIAFFWTRKMARLTEEDHELLPIIQQNLNQQLVDGLINIANTLIKASRIKQVSTAFKTTLSIEVANWSNTVASLNQRNINNQQGIIWPIDIFEELSNVASGGHNKSLLNAIKSAYPNTDNQRIKELCSKLSNAIEQFERETTVPTAALLDAAKDDSTLYQVLYPVDVFRWASVLDTILPKLCTREFCLALLKKSAGTVETELTTHLVCSTLSTIAETEKGVIALVSSPKELILALSNLSKTAYSPQISLLWAAIINDSLLNDDLEVITDNQQLLCCNEIIDGFVNTSNEALAKAQPLENWLMAVNRLATDNEEAQKAFMRHKDFVIAFKNALSSCIELENCHTAWQCMFAFDELTSTAEGVNQLSDQAAVLDKLEKFVTTKLAEQASDDDHLEQEDAIRSLNNVKSRLLSSPSSLNEGKTGSNKPPLSFMFKAPDKNANATPSESTSKQAENEHNKPR